MSVLSGFIEPYLWYSCNIKGMVNKRAIKGNTKIEDLIAVI